MAPIKNMTPGSVGFISTQVKLLCYIYSLSCMVMNEACQNKQIASTSHTQVPIGMSERVPQTLHRTPMEIIELKPYNADSLQS